MTALATIKNAELPATADAQIDAARTTRDVVSVFAGLGFDPADDEADGIRSLEVVKDKDTLIGKPFMAVRWRFNEGDMGTFVSIECMREDGTLFVLNDGSTGIRDQFLAVTEHRTANQHPAPQAGRLVRRGLSRSDYQVENPSKPGEMMSATTYYAQF